MADQSNQADLNKRATMGRLSKKQPKKPKVNTWAKKQWEDEQDRASRVQVQHDRPQGKRGISREKLEEIRLQLLNEAHAVKVSFGGEDHKFVKVTTKTKPVLERLHFFEDKTFFLPIDDEAKTTLVAAEFRFNWEGVKRPTKTNTPKPTSAVAV